MKSIEPNFIAGKLIRTDHFEAFLPNYINKEFHLQNNKTLMLLEKASATIGKLNYLCGQLPLNNYVSMLILLEAMGSSSIEGTHSSAEEVLSPDTGNDENQEVNNLFDTINEYYNGKNRNSNISDIKTIENIHHSLMFNTKKNQTEVGKIRTGQNFIGGKSELSALFVPPPAKYLKDLLIDLGNFWENPILYIPILIKIAIYHYQFETIHPFYDGNGRTGRVLINLQLKESGLLNYPVLCLSEYWGQNKSYYYDALTIVRSSNDIEYWIRFFLESIINTCEERITTITKINKLREDTLRKIESNIKSSTKHKAFLDLILQKPYITVGETKDKLNITYQAANRIITDFVKLNILTAKNDNKRNRIFEFKEYQDIIFKYFI